MGLKLGSINLNLPTPNGSEELIAGTTYDITWETEGTVENILIGH